MKIWSGLDLNKNEISKDLKYTDPKLESVLEPHIKKIVLVLIKKNFKTISSCSGHSYYEDAHVTFVSPSKEIVYFFKRIIKFFLGINIKIRDFKDFGNVKKTRLGPIKYTPSEEEFKYKMSLFTKTNWENYYPIEITFGYAIYPSTPNKLFLYIYNIFFKKIMMYLFLLFLKLNLKNFDYYIK
jgi:hypothetical protein